MPLGVSSVFTPRAVHIGSTQHLAVALDIRDVFEEGDDDAEQEHEADGEEEGGA